MLANLHNYIDISIKYIFIFKKEHVFMDEDFLISDSWTDLQMPGLWNRNETMEIMLSLPYDIRHSDQVHREWINDQPNYDRNNYHRHVAGIKRVIHQTHRDVIENNPSIQFEVINVPITFLLYYKITRLSLCCGVDCSFIEIREILKYCKLFRKHMTIRLVKFICKYFLTNEKLLREIETYRDNSSDDKGESKLINILTPIFGTEEEILQFTKLVRSHIVFYLFSKMKTAIELSANVISYPKYCLDINQSGLAFVFFFNKLEISYKWLMDNRDTLDTLFTDNMIFSAYSVVINHPISLSANINGIYVLKQLLHTITTSKFLTGANVDQLTLELRDIHTNVDLSCLETLKASITVVCKNCSLNFLKSIPAYIKIAVFIYTPFYTESLNDTPEKMVELYMRSSIEFFSDTPKNVVELSCDKIRFDNNIKISDSIEKINIFQCVISPNKTLMLSKNCKHLKIYDMAGKIIFPFIMECYMESTVTKNISKFKFWVDKEDNEKMLVLNAVTIYTKVNIIGNIKEVIFTYVISKSIVVFNDKVKHLMIENSEGLFDLRPYMGIVQYFEKNMVIETLHTKKSHPDLLTVQLRAFHFIQTAEFSNIYESVELNYVSTATNEEIIINKACKKLVVNSCRAVINIQKVVYLESLHIRFAINEDNYISFIGSGRVGYIHLSGICRNINSITAILTCFDSIQHIKFDDNSIITDNDFRNYYCSLMELITSKEGYENNLDMLSKLLTIDKNDSSIFNYEIRSIVVNFILKSVINEEVMNTVSKLELERIAIDSDNFKSLKKLKNLKVLKIHSKQISSELLYHLPLNLEFLDITDLFINKTNWTKKYAIKPSIIVVQYKNLKVLRVEAEFLYNVRSLSVLMPCLEVLEIQYSQSIKANSRMPVEKIKIRELLVRCSGFDRAHRNEIIPNKNEMIGFMNELKFYIDFKFLECITFIHSDNLVFFDPKTLQVIE